MKKMYYPMKLAVLSLFLIITFGGFSLHAHESQNRRARMYAGKAQNVDGFKVAKGHRPPIDYSQIHPEAYHQGTLYVKIQADAHDKMRIETLEKAPYTQVRTGFSALDKIYDSFGVYEMNALLPESFYSKNGASEEFRKRHAAWGFHLWYEIHYTSKEDPIVLMNKMLQIHEVEKAEPVFKKRLIEPVESTPLTPAKNKSGSFSPDDMYFESHQWGLKNTGQDIGVTGTEEIDIQAEAAWSIETGNPSVVVSVHDSGIELDHADVAANLWPQIGIQGLETLAGSHGTHVGGTVAAVTNNKIGVAGVAGGDGNNNGVRLMTLDVFIANPSTYQGFVYAADNGAAISQNSWGYQDPGVYNVPDLNGIDYYNINGGGHALIDGGIVIFAAGNDNTNQQWYPAFYDGAMSVGSFDNRGRKSSFSNYGSWVDISAPGTNIASLEINNGYSLKSGTSMACPHVSGVAALVVSHAYGVLTPDMLWDILTEHVENIYDLPTNQSYNNQLGSGRLNAYLALKGTQALLPHAPKSFVANTMENNSIKLNWTKNDAQDEVVVLLNHDFYFGALQQGTDYEIGDSIPGGGIVLYEGNRNFMHLENLQENTPYFFRIYSKTDDGNYSPSKMAHAISHWNDEPIFFEGFEPVDELLGGALPVGWELKRNTEEDGGLDGANLQNIDYDYESFDSWWQLSSHFPFEDTRTFPFIRTGEAAMAIPYDAPGFSWAITPEIEIPDYLSEAYLSFWKYYTADGLSGLFPSILHLNVFFDEEWHTAESWIEEANNQYEDTVRVNLSDYIGSTIRLAFVHQENDGYRMAIDDILIEGISTKAEIVGFSLPEQFDEAVIDSENARVELEVIPGTDLSNLSPIIRLSKGAFLNVPATQNMDFSEPVVVTVIAQDGETQKEWTLELSLSEIESSEAEVLSFYLQEAIDEATLIYDDGNGKGIIDVQLPNQVEASLVFPIIEISAGATLSVNPSEGLDLSEPLTIMVTAQDLTTKEWIINAINLPSDQAEILSFSVEGQLEESEFVFNSRLQKELIQITFVETTDISALVPEIQISEGATISPELGVAQNFSEPLEYTVTAEDGFTQKTYVLDISYVVGVQEMANHNDIRVYPNPSKGHMNVTSDLRIDKLEILDLLGRRMDAFVVNNFNATFSIENLPEGVYLLKLHLENDKVFLQRIIKK